MTHVFVMTSHKGGVGKTTTATNVAFGLVQMLRQAGAERHHVLLIDTDSQCHATLMTTGRKNYGRDDSLYTVLTAERQTVSRQQKWDSDEERERDTFPKMTV